MEIDLSNYVPYEYLEPLRKRNKERNLKLKKELDKDLLLNTDKAKVEFSQYCPAVQQQQNRKIEFTMEDFPVARAPDPRPGPSVPK